MGSEERQAQDGIRKEVSLKLANPQQKLRPAVDVEKLLEPEQAARAIWELVGRLERRGSRRRSNRWKVKRGGLGSPVPDQPVDLGLPRRSEFGAGDRTAVRIPSGLSVADGMGGGQSSQPVGLPRAASGGAEGLQP